MIQCHSVKVLVTHYERSSLPFNLFASLYQEIFCKGKMISLSLTYRHCIMIQYIFKNVLKNECTITS
jgi:hypothetical protein